MSVVRQILFFTIFFLSVNVALASDISQIVFAPESAQTAKTNEAALLTIQLQYSGDSHPTACMKMFTDSATGQFSSSNSNWNSVDKLTINSNWTNKNFYYKDATAGAYIITVKVISGVSCVNLADQEAQWTASHNIIISDLNSTAVVEPVSEPAAGVGLSEWPVEPQIYANAGEDQTGIAGADVYFFGKALGLQKEPLANARYLWNFGDGAISESQNVKHVYKYPGEYIVILDVSSGKYSASGRLTAKIIPNQLEIIEANQNYIKLHNGSNVELDISHWFLRAENIFFKFQSNTFIKANKDLIIDSYVSGLKVENQKAELLYPNGSIAYVYNNQDVITLPADVSHQVMQAGNNQTSLVAAKPPESKTENIEPLTSNKTSNNNKSQDQTASVINSSQENSINLTEWILIILGIGILAGGGLIFIRRQNLL